MKSSKPTHNIKNWSTTLKKMNCLLALTHFKSMFQFYTPWEHKKRGFFSEVWKWNIGLKLARLILNNFMNGYLIFCLQLSRSRTLFNWVTVCCEWDLNPQLLDKEAGMLTTWLKTNTSLEECLLNVVASSPIHNIMQPF